ncbi:MAG: hypothetical protein H0X40_06455 [Chthoniobacterales bacterium]|nr:hypothetical protein [Chthoniobacterales bacterium]
MKLFSAGLTLVNVATVVALLLGILGGGLDSGFAGLALIAGTAAAVVAWIYSESYTLRSAAIPVATGRRRSKRAQPKEEPQPSLVLAPRRVWHFWTWAAAALFALFALRSFCWLLYVDGPGLKIQSPNNLGDLSLHLTYIKYFANGVALWPDNPIFVFSKLRYPVGIDLFNSLLLLAHVDLVRGLVWVGLLASLATFYGFYRWGGPFAVAAFLCNGGVAGYEFFRTLHFQDYQGEAIAWKSIPLTMFVTQRGLLYAIPAGLLLLLHWRRKFFSAAPNEQRTATSRGLIPWWVEWSLYATMPLYHVHTFLALSVVLGCWLVMGTPVMRKQIALLLAAAFLPATGMLWLITDHFQAKSILAWAPGWLESDPSFGKSIIRFWLVNFGLMLPLTLFLVGLAIWRMWKRCEEQKKFTLTTPVAFVVPAVAIFLFAFFVKTAPWGWDNTKLIIWAYFIILPFLWREVIATWFWPVRMGVCFVLFASGFVCLIGGLEVGSPGFDLVNRIELSRVETVVRRIPIEERFAGFPTYNHLLLLSGRKMVLGYPGHLWTQGFTYPPVESQLQALMLGAPDWRERAKGLHTRYLFWGEEEKRAYASSTQPWRDKSAVVASGNWGTIYDLEGDPAASLH